MSPADKSMTNECSAVITERKNCEECDGDTPASNDGHRDLNVITVGFYNNLTINFHPLKIIQHHHHRQRLN